MAYLNKADAYFIKLVSMSLYSFRLGARIHGWNHQHVSTTCKSKQVFRNIVISCIFWLSTHIPLDEKVDVEVGIAGKNGVKEV